jgi:hypothetical protein
MRRRYIAFGNAKIPGWCRPGLEKHGLHGN